MQFGICALPDSLHIPIDDLEKNIDKVKTAMEEKQITDKDGKQELFFPLLIC